MTIIMWIATGLLLILSFSLKKTETKKAIKKAKAMMGTMMPQILAILLAIGLVLGIIPPSLIEKVLGQGQTFISIIIASVFGSVTIIPGFVAFPLVGSLVNQGADYSVAAAFITTLTMVGIATMSLESKQFGYKFTLYRNGLSFLGAIMIAILLGMVM